MRRVAVVLLALWPAVAGAELRARTRDLGAASPVVGLVAWDKGGSADWGAGIPAPTIDCAAVGTSSAASMQCSGATPSFAGSAQTAAGSPWWYRGDAGVRPAIALNGSTDYWNLGNQPTCGEKQVVLIAFTPTTVAGAEYLVSIDDRSSKRDFGIYRNGSGVVPTWFRSGGGSFTELPVSGLVAGSAFVFAASYDATGGNGAGVLRANLNGVAAAPVTTGVAPLQNLTDQPLGIGAAIGAAPLLSSSKIRRVARWCGADAPTSAAQLAQMVATQQGLAADRPAGAYSPIARTDSTLCCPFSDAECFTVGPGGPCIHAPSYSGWAGTGPGIEVYGPGANLIPASDPTSWTQTSNAATKIASAKDAVGPDGAANSASTLTVASALGDATYDLYRSATATTSVGATYTYSIWLKAGTYSGASTFPIGVHCGGNYVGLKDCPVSSVFSRCSVQFVAPFTACSGDVGGLGKNYTGVPTTPARGTGTVVSYGGQITPTAYPVPYRPTTGTAYAGNASTATQVPSPWPLFRGAAINNRCKTVRACSTGAWTGRDVTLWSEGLFATSQVNSARLRLYTNGAIWVYVNSSNGTQQLLAVAPKLESGECHSITTCARNGDLSLYLDRVLVASVASGAGGGTGLYSAAPATEYLGSLNDGTLQAGMSFPGSYYVGSPLITRSHKYIPENVRVQVLGDSLSAAYSVPNAYSVRLASLLGRPVYNYASAGADTTTIRGSYKQAEGQRWIALLGGINDVVGLNSAAAPILANLSYIANTATQRGSNVVLMTLLPFGNSGTWTSARQAVLEEVNAGIRAMASPTVRVVDTYALMAEPGQPTELAAAYDHDGLHLNQAGTDRLADLVYAAMQ